VSLREELQFHLDEEAEQRQAEGLAKDQARWAARRDLGNFALLQESTRAMWTWTSLEQLVQDLRYALRTMINNRAFTALAAQSLALGIGANTAIYSFLDALLLRSLPVSDPASLVVLNWHAKAWRKDFVMQGMSGSVYDDPKLGSTSDIFPYRPSSFSKKTTPFLPMCSPIAEREKRGA
jgi:macrolide transport system ATP-binding/permease protein